MYLGDVIVFYVYVYYCPTTDIPFYVGKGSGDRLHYHVHNRRTHSNKQLGIIISEIVNGGQQVRIEVPFTTTIEQEAYNHERYLVSKYGRLDLTTGTLANRSGGGEGFGTAGCGWSDELREKMKCSRTPKVGQSVIQYDLNGNVIREWSYSDICANYKVSDINRIRLCCRGKAITACGNKWSYMNSDINQKIDTRIKQIYKFTKTGELVTKFSNISEASSTCKINASDI